MSPVQRRAIAAMAKQGLGTVRTRMGWVWPEDVRESDTAARAVLEALADPFLSSVTKAANPAAQD